MTLHPAHRRGGPARASELIDAANPISLVPPQSRTARAWQQATWR
jgi:hypothetical protein